MDSSKFKKQSLDVQINISEIFGLNVSCQKFKKYYLILNDKYLKIISFLFQYEDKTYKVPIIVFKYDSTRKNELKVVQEIYNSEIVHFGVFERDKPPEAKLIATSIEEFELMTFERTR